MLLAFSIILCTILLDQFVKWWVVTHLSLYATQPLIPHVVGLTHVHNTGASWGILAGQQLLFIGLTVGVLAYLIYSLYQARTKHWGARLAYSLLIGGAIGNLIDRVRQGYVVDMFEFKWIQFPIFNIADSALTIGVVLLLIMMLTDKEGTI